MKKFYLLLTVGLLTLSAIVITKYVRPTEKQFSSNEFTPEEIWQKRFQEKKAKLNQGVSKADKPDMFSKYFKDITTRIGESKSGYQMNYKTQELQKARDNAPRLKSTKAALEFIQRGPANVGGRTRAIVVDPDDSEKNTWYAGSATGGIWKTTDGSENWTNLSDDLTNLSVNALFMAPSDHDVIYAGTGESFPGGTRMIGNGIWKSVDRGENWIQMASTATDEKFSSVNRLWVNPIDADIVLAATEYGIFKTLNGGTDWTQVYESDPEDNGIEVLVAHPDEENIIYAGENSKGVLRSLDGGNSWELASKGLPQEGRRYEIAVSPQNRDVVYTTVNVSDKESYVCISKNRATDWHLYKDKDNNAENDNLLGTQGEYDNTIAGHPFNENEVFVAGVNMWKVTFDEIPTEKDGITEAYTQAINFLSFVDFGGSHLGGGLSTEEGADVLSTDWTSVEIRFGKGISQKAHRFTVPSQSTSGVAASNYTYQDYVEVPFQVWDTKNNKQLMVSFRDQEKDEAFNLYSRGEDDSYGNLGREYIFINAVEYNAETADENIAVSGGHTHKALYMIWALLVPGAQWDAENLPTSKIVVKYGVVQSYEGVTTSVADAYGNFGGGNNYSQGPARGTTKIPGVHPDHHNITIIPLDDTNFRVINGNDGGIGVSEDNGITFNQRPNNYITTQFYGVAKNPEANEYIGGMQDNGTWQSEANEDASSNSKYYFRIWGDGFECLWHATDPKKLLGTVYNNTIWKSTNGGQSWSSNINGIAEDDGPFITRLSSSKKHPDVVFAVGSTGVYKSTDFGSNWKLKTIGSKWSRNGYASSQHNVEVSLNNPQIVWAGAAMVNNGDFKIHVSEDEGETYRAVNEYSERNMAAYISGIATHPTEPNTAYLLFSTNKAPKILRTTDLGQNWEDISGYGTDTKSNNGFPDVVTHCLLVMPHNTKTIWAGTEIGMFESTDNGVSWHVLDGNLPPVSVYDMHLVGNQVVIATHGRGVWSVDIPEIDRIPEIVELKEVEDKVINLNMEVKVEYEKLEIYLNEKLSQTIATPEIGEQSFPITVDQAGIYNFHVIGYINEESFKSNQEEFEVKDKTPELSSFEILKDYKLKVQVELPVRFNTLEVYINEEKVKTVVNPSDGIANYEISVEEAGIYTAYIIGYIFDTPFQSNTKELEIIPTGIETIKENSGEMKIYPNPSRGVFKLQLGNSNKEFSLEIYDLSGKKVYSQIDQNVGDNTIRVESLKNGFYIVRVTIDGKVMSSKIQIIK